MSEQITLETGEVLDVSAYPLPEGVEDGILNMKTLARAMRVSTVTISQRVDEGMPVHQVGGNGKAYEFRLSHCHAWLVWRDKLRDDQQRQSDAIADQYALEFLGGGDQVPDVAALTPKQMREYAEAELKRNQAAEQRGDLMRRHLVERLVEDMLVIFRSGTIGLPDWMEQEFSLSPTQVEKAQAYADGILAEVRSRMKRAGFEAPSVIDIEGLSERA